MLKLKNSEIISVINFLTIAPLKTKASRARSVVIKKLVEKNDELNKFQDEILEKFAEKDENGEVIKDEHGTSHWEKDHIKEGNEAIQELRDEEIYINIEEYRPNMKILGLALDNLDMELSGQDAIAYDLLMDQLEEESEED